MMGKVGTASAPDFTAEVQRDFPWLKVVRREPRTCMAYVPAGWVVFHKVSGGVKLEVSTSGVTYYRTEAPTARKATQVFTEHYARSATAAILEAVAALRPHVMLRVDLDDDGQPIVPTGWKQAGPGLYTRGGTTVDCGRNMLSVVGVGPSDTSGDCADREYPGVAPRDVILAAIVTAPKC